MAVCSPPTDYCWFVSKINLYASTLVLEIRRNMSHPRDACARPIDGLFMFQQTWYWKYAANLSAKIAYTREF